jgi:hypothetical protein
VFCLETKELYIVKTELTKNRTCQSHRWKQVALCETADPLIKMMRENQRVINWDNLKVVAIN